MGATFQFQAKDRIFFLGQRTWLMGVVNVTPDSFYDGGFYFDPARAVERGLTLVAEGADILDIGGESTRPGSEPIPVEEEKRRVVPVIAALREKTDVPISIDTTKAEVAEAAIAAGACIVNDISAGRFDPRMLPLVAGSGVGLVLMHMKGTPKTMQINPSYVDVLAEVKTFLSERMETVLSFGIRRENLIIDPGIGFGKNLEHNLLLLNRLDTFQELGRPILVGVSRKSFIGHILNLEAQHRLEGTIAAAVIAIQRGASVLRVHDAQAIKRAITVAEAILGPNKRLEPLKGTENPYVH
ncbi:MAG: dihydropteroate synthase [Candidatus Aminicenantales bacterium]